MQFAKYHALGNDYLVVERVDFAERLSPSTVRRICDRHFGIGSDGILVHEPSSDPTEFRLRILNPDGSEAEKSSNGLRIFARYLWDRRLVSDSPFKVVTPGGAVLCQVREHGRSVTVEMGQVRFHSRDIPVLGPPREVIRETSEVAGQDLEFTAATIGNPHCVILRQQVSQAEASSLGPLIETDSRFPNRTNVQFMQVLDRANIQIEIWERGAGYTLASGSSSCASAAVAKRLGLCDSAITVHMPGGTLAIEVDDNFFVRMTGPVGKVAEGSMSDELLEHLFESLSGRSSQLSFRFVATSDIDQLAEWNHQLIRDEGHRNRMTVPELGERMRGWLEHEYRAIVFELAGTPVANALFREQPAEIYLRQLFVVRERRRQGIGRRAIELLRTQVWPTNKRLTVEVLTANTAAVGFWRSGGYRDYSLTLEIVPEMAAQTFRPLRVDELRAAYDVYLHAFYALQDKSIRQWPRPMPLEVYEQRQLRDENFGYFVGDALAVIVSLARQESADWREETGGQTHWWLKTLATAEEFHGRRLGEQTVAACETWLRERGEKKLLLNCADAGFLPHFYARLGFQVVARKRISYPSGDASAMVLMEKSLAANQDHNHAAIMQIRRYIPGEEGAIWAVYFGSTRNVVAKEYTPDQVQRWAPDSPDWQKWAGDLARTNPFVAVINGQLVGFAELESDGHINNFYCHHEFQRQGIGTALFRALEQEAIRLGLPALFAEVSTTGIKFFIAQGFDIEEERCNIVCHAPARQFIVRKGLIHADVVHENGAD